METPGVEDGSSVEAPLPLGQLRVLVADDNHDQVLAVVTLLRQQGYEARGVHNGEDALKVLKVFDAHAVILDIDMPGRNGYEIAGEIRKQQGPVPLLIACTAHTTPEDAAMAKVAGFHHHVPKPFPAEHLLALLRAMHAPDRDQTA